MEKNVTRSSATFPRITRGCLLSPQGAEKVRESFPVHRLLLFPNIRELLLLPKIVESFPLSPSKQSVHLSPRWEWVNERVRHSAEKEGDGKTTPEYRWSWWKMKRVLFLPILLDEVSGIFILLRSRHHSPAVSLSSFHLFPFRRSFIRNQ